MKNSKKYKQKKEAKLKEGITITYTKSDSGLIPILYYFLRTNYFNLIIRLNFKKSDKLIRSLIQLVSGMTSV